MSQTRSTNFDVFAPEDTRQTVIGSIRLYRALLRQAYCGVAMAEMASANVSHGGGNVTVKPSSENASVVLALAFGWDGKGFGYQLRRWVLEEMAPTWYSGTWDSLRTDLVNAWTARDPEITKASRGFLVVNGARDLARFNHRGIGFPAVRVSKVEGHSITLVWDHEIGPVTFKLGKLDGGRYMVWRSLRDTVDGWSLGTVYLNERDGELRLTVTYHMPDTEVKLDKSRILTVEFGGQPEAFMTAVCEGRSFAGDKISAIEALSFCGTMEAIQEKMKRRRKATGNPRKKWGSAKVWHSVVDKQNRATDRRANGVKHWNHVWTRRIIEHAIRVGAGSLVVVGLPEKLLGEFSWPWTQFKAFLNYKAGAIGATVEYV